MVLAAFLQFDEKLMRVMHQTKTVHLVKKDDPRERDSVKSLAKPVKSLANPLIDHTFPVKNLANPLIGLRSFEIDQRLREKSVAGGQSALIPRLFRSDRTAPRSNP